MSTVEQQQQQQLPPITTTVLLPNLSSTTPMNSKQVAYHNLISILTRFHGGYFRISLSLCGQALLWNILSKPTTDDHALRHIVRVLPSAALVFLWSLALFSLVALCVLYAVRCLLCFDSIKAEFSHHVGVNYLFVPWISWLLLLQCTPFLHPDDIAYRLLWLVFSMPILVLDVKIYGQWFTKGKNYLSTAANPTSHMTVIANLVVASTAADMGWRESATCVFAVGMVHYLVLFVTLYQRIAGSDSLPQMLRPVFFLFFAAPSMASLAWASISGKFDTTSKMLFFLSLFLFASLVSRANMFKRSMRRFSVAWWAYSFPLTMLALAATEYADKVKGGVPDTIMLLLSLLSVIVTFALILLTAVKTTDLLPDQDPFPPVPASQTIPTTRINTS